MMYIFYRVGMMPGKPARGKVRKTHFEWTVHTDRVSF